MDLLTIDKLCAALAEQAGLYQITRSPIRIWELSGVERLHAHDGRTAIVKYATVPFTGEARLLRAAHTHGMPVPAVHASAARAGHLVMLLEDLGDPLIRPTLADAAAAAVATHSTEVAAAPWAAAQMRRQPARTLLRLRQLQAADRLTDVDDLIEILTALALAAPARIAGATSLPTGLCHGELHPTSVHLGRSGLRVLDLAKAYTGIGMIDLACWFGTREPGDPDRMGHLLDLYIAAGGSKLVLANRGGLPAPAWALGWHRIWAAGWLVTQMAAGRVVTDGSSGAHHMEVLRRQLTDAARLLAV